MSKVAADNDDMRGSIIDLGQHGDALVIRQGEIDDVPFTKAVPIGLRQQCRVDADLLQRRLNAGL